MRIDNKIIGRRHWLKFLGLGSLALAACKSASRRENRRSQMELPPRSQQTLEDSLSTDVDSQGSNEGSTQVNRRPGEAPPKEQTIPCGEVKVNLADFEVAGENLETKFTFYGDSESAMLVLSLPKYSHGLLRSVTIMQLPSEKVVAQRGVFEGSDIKEDTTLRPIVFDNLKLGTDTRIAVLFKNECSRCESGYEFLKRVMGENIVFENVYNGKPVYALTSSSLPDFFVSHQSLATLNVDAETLYTEGNFEFPTKDSAFDIPGKEACQFTDLTGDPIALPGELPDVNEHSEFICYRLIEDTFYIREFLTFY